MGELLLCLIPFSLGPCSPFSHTPPHSHQVRSAGMGGLLQHLTPPLALSPIPTRFPHPSNSDQVRSAGMGDLLLRGNGFPDAVNTAETVSMDPMPRGTVAISIVARSLFFKYSPQPYALVVLGKFTGVLLSPYNPVSQSGCLNSKWAL